MFRRFSECTAGAQFKVVEAYLKKHAKNQYFNPYDPSAEKFMDSFAVSHTPLWVPSKLMQKNFVASALRWSWTLEYSWSKFEFPAIF